MGRRALAVFVGALSLSGSAIALFVPSLLRPHRSRQRWRGRPHSLPHLSAVTKTGSRKSVAGVGVPKKTSARKSYADAPIDKVQLAEQTEDVPLGQLTQDQRRDMLTVMRQLSSMDRRRDDLVATSSKDGSHTWRRRQDAAMVERLLDRLLREHQYSVEFADSVGQNGRDVNARTYNLAIKAWANANVRGSAEKAERVLKRLKVANINEEKALTRVSSSSLQPDLYSFAYCYAAWYREAAFSFAANNGGNNKASASAMRKAESVLQSMKQVLMRDESRRTSRSPLNMMEDVNSLLVMWSNTNVNLPDLSEKFLRFVEVESRCSTDVWLNARSYNLVINAWAKSGSEESVSRAEALLSQMEKSSKVSPNLLTYSGVISCIAQSKRATDVKRAEDVLQRLMEANGRPDNGKATEDVYATTNTLKLTSIPPLVIFNQVMNIYSKQGKKGSAERCEQLLRRMESLASAGNELVAPDTRTWNLILSAYANEKGPADAEKVIARMHESDINPNSISYTTVMDAFAKVGDAHNSLRILSLMEKEFKDGNEEAKPTRRAYVSALNSLAKSGRGDAGMRAESLVQTMERMGLKPDTNVYNVLINCHKNSAARAEKVLYRMGKRDVYSYSSVITAHANAGGVKAAKRAQALLDEMQKEDVEPNAHAFNSAITAWSRSGSRGAAQKAEGLLKRMEELYEETGNLSLQPSARVYTSVITAWSKSNEPGSALRAEILLKLMWAMYKRGNKAAKPTSHTFTSAINAWGRSRDQEAGARAEALLDQMLKLYERGDKDVKPNVLTLTAVIHAYARSGAWDATSKVDSILRKMEAIGVQPNLRTYNELISLYGNSQQQGAAKKAEGVLTKLESEYQNGRKEMRPTVVSYTSCINAWAKSTDHGKATKANAILERMKEMHFQGVVADQPNEFSYTAVINACATTYGDEDEKQEAFRIAYSVFKEISDSERLKPNHVTYSTFLRAISKLVPNGEKKDSLISAAFRLCIRDGQVDDNSLFHMKNAASQDLVCDLLGCSDYSEANALSLDDLPFDWTQNVKGRSRSMIK